MQYFVPTTSTSREREDYDEFAALSEVSINTDCITSFTSNGVTIDQWLSLLLEHNPSVFQP